MKLSKLNIGLGLAVLAALSSCADDKFSEYKTDMTKDLAEYQYLNDYEPLKNYVEQLKSAGKCNPDFKLGVALGASDFNKRELVYSLAGSNFMEMTAGNAMKYASCVKDDGRMDFSTVKEFVSNAKEGGITIYGHTLAWHSQQNNKYLNGLIADRELQVDPNAKVEKTDFEKDWTTAGSYTYWAPNEVKANITVNGDGFKLVNAAATDNWRVQYNIADGLPLKKDSEYILKMTVKGSGEGTLAVGIGDWGGRANGSIAFNTDWKEYAVPFKAVANGGFVICQSGAFVGTLQIRNVKIVHMESPMVEIPKYVYENNFDGSDVLSGWGNGSIAELASGSHDGSKCMVVTNPGTTNSWSVQRAVDQEFENGKTYYLHFWGKADNPGNFGAGFQKTDGYQGRGDFPAMSLTTTWKEFTVQTTVTGEGCNRFLFNLGAVAGKIYIDDVQLYYMEKSNKIPLSDSEKKTILTTAMATWVDGMMEACDGYVTSWDVVNEPISGRDKDGDGYYDLQSATRGTVSEDDAKKNFYWQDYLGDLDYVRTAVAEARKGFAAHNGDAAKLKLFINDYNLESDWDDNKKLKSLIHWIGEWEKDGVTRIDGIGSQMHVSFSANPTVQKSKEEHVVKMLQLMATTGKLVKISELDMGYNDAAGNAVMTENLTEAQHKQMSDYYRFIVGQYFKIIPASQQYGITQWCITDSPKDSGWRGGEPTGLWDANFLRKHTYAGFADGLRGE